MKIAPEPIPTPEPKKKEESQKPVTQNTVS